MKSRSGKEGEDWVPAATPLSEVDPVYYFGCKTVEELSRYYLKTFNPQTIPARMISAIVHSNDQFCNGPVENGEWPKIQLALALVNSDQDFRSRLDYIGMFSVNRGCGK